LAALQAICAGLDVEATALGEFTGDGRLRILYGDDLVGDIDVQFLHDGIPRRHLRAEWSPPQLSIVNCQLTIDNLTDALLALLAMPETRSKEAIVRQYDHEVQGGTLVKPFLGAANAGPSDAAVLRPLDALRLTNLPVSQSTSHRSVALSIGANPFYTALDPYCMAWAAVDEALRNVVAVGADPDQVSLLDNFSWGNPNLPDRLGSLVRCVQGCHDAAVAFGAPFISGKDSLNNEYTGADGQKHAIPGTLVVSALGIVPDVSCTATMDLKRSGDWLYIVGLTRGELGGSSLARRFGTSGSGIAPQPPENALEIYRALHQAISSGLVQACHDCSEGGLAVTAAEMALAGGLGLELRLAVVPRTDDVSDDAAIAFCESLGRLLVEVRPSASDKFEALLAGHPMARIGRVRGDRSIVMTGLDGTTVIDTDLDAVELVWRGQMNG
jgi:phosphoribosylformylglycinamidine synthase subunit PurSL